MAHKIPSKEEEAAFMNDLLGDLDDSFWNAVPTPENSPVKKKPATARLPSTPLRKSTKHAAKDFAPSPSQVFVAGDVDVAAMFDGADDWDLDMDNIDSPRKSSPKKNATSAFSQKPQGTRQASSRCIVESIHDIEAARRWQKKLTVKVEPGEERRQVILHDDWFYTDLRVGDIINVVGYFSPLATSSSTLTATISITAQENFLILHPDILITATALSNAPQCRRKPLLSALVRSTSDTTPALVWGSMLHEIMQTCLTENRWEESWINEQIDESIIENLSELVKIDIKVEQAKQELTTRARGLRVFAERYLSNTPKPGAILTDTRSSAKQGPSLLAINQILDIEEDIWSPTYGIKGKLDVTVNVVISDPSPTQGIFRPTHVTTVGPKPFEIKTGRTVAGLEHRAQTMLYTLLASERYGADVPSGLLYYTQSDEVVRVPTSRNELRALICARNEMAVYMMRRLAKANSKSGAIADAENAVEEHFLPPTIDDDRLCKRCYTLDTCMLYRKAFETPIDPSSPLYDTFELKTAHLTPAQAAFFRKWETLLTYEEQDAVRFKKELWTMGAVEREKKGRCFSGMALDNSFQIDKPYGNLPEIEIEDANTTTSSSKIHRYTYRFVRAGSTRQTAGNLLNGHMSVGDAVTVSVEPHLLALARGFIVGLTPSNVTVGVDHDLSSKVIAARYGASEDKVFRIDKDEFGGLMGRIRDNLAHLFYADGDQRRLELIVDLRPPVFSTTTPELSLECQHFIEGFNCYQKAAVMKVLSAEDYTLILGMPGTGKTTVIAGLLKLLVEQGKTVLLSSYTHSAVDTILRKLDDADFGILRIGNIDKIHPDVRKHTLGARKKATSVEQLEQQLMTPPVVATTCLSVDHALFSRRKFDYCIVDEASQITLPTCLGPLRYAEKFVLVGDHFQLPPLVRNSNAKKGGLDVSLFRHLSDGHPNAVVDLTYQYRMNKEIMLLSNHLIYNNRLQCGSEAVAEKSLVLPDKTFLNALEKECMSCSGRCWIKDLVSENCKAVFVDTDLVPARDSRVGDLVQNEVEASLACQITETLLRCGVPEQQIGIISLYQQQIKLLSHLLQDRKGIEILTADKSQGRDKECIIISLVRSNDGGHLGDLVKDWRRINVSFTRARSKLIIIGSRNTLKKDALLSQFFELMEKQSWIVRLPPGAEKMHAAAFEIASTPGKRPAESEEGHSGSLKENTLGTINRPRKKMKTKEAGQLDQGFLRSRPILTDIIHENM